MESGIGFFYDFSLSVVWKNFKIFVFLFSFDVDVFDKVWVSNIVKEIVWYCD